MALMYIWPMLRALTVLLAGIFLFALTFSKPNFAQDQSPSATKAEALKTEVSKSEAPKVETKSQGRIIGIGGIFFKTADQAKTREWYAAHLGIVDKGGGAMLPWREKDDPQKEHVTAWSAFPSNTKYFGPGEATFMIDYIVDDLDAMLERLQKEGVKIDPKRMNESFGRFAWIYDLDGNKIELWEPAKAKDKP